MPKPKRERDPDLQPPEKMADSVRVRMPAKLKEQLRDALAEDFEGNYSRFFIECARAAVMHHRRKEQIATPVEFVTAKR